MTKINQLSTIHLSMNSDECDEEMSLVILSESENEEDGEQLRNLGEYFGFFLNKTPNRLVLVRLQFQLRHDFKFLLGLIFIRIGRL